MIQSSGFRLVVCENENAARHLVPNSFVLKRRETRRERYLVQPPKISRWLIWVHKVWPQSRSSRSLLSLNGSWYHIPLIVGSSFELLVRVTLITPSLAQIVQHRVFISYILSFGDISFPCVTLVCTWWMAIRAGGICKGDSGLLWALW